MPRRARDLLSVKGERLLILLCVFGVVLGQSQPSSLAGRLENWPPPGWPQGARGEVRLGFEGSSAPASAVAVIGGDGRFNLDLRGVSSIPADAWGSLARALRLEQGCSFTPTVESAGARAAIATMAIFTVGSSDMRGLLRIERREPKNANEVTGDISFLIYADRDVTVQGDGLCGGNVSVQVKDTVRRGWNLIHINATFRPSGGTATVRVAPAPVGRFEIMPSGR